MSSKILYRAEKAFQCGWLLMSLVLALFVIAGKLGFCLSVPPLLASSLSDVVSVSMFITFGCVLLLSLHSDTKGGKAALLFFFLLLFTAVVLLKSRTSVIAVLVVGMFILRPAKNWVRYFFLLLSVGLLLYIKSDSTRGRWFIYQLTCEHIMEHPLFGWGHDGFRKYYMDWQAAYFAEYTNSNYAMLADNIRHPLSEILLIAANYGLFGVIMVSLFAIAIIQLYRKHPSTHSKNCMAILLCLSVFSMFSYPFYYSFARIMLVYALSIIAFYSKMFTAYKPQCTFITIVTILITAGTRFNHRLLEKKWENAIEKSEKGRKRSVLPEYDYLYHRMKDNPFFLYNYAAVLYDAGNYPKSLQIANECKSMLADYDLCLLLGDIHLEMNHTGHAIGYYKKASYMCPSHFSPLCSMYYAYRRSNQFAKCKDIKELIRQKTIKIRSRETLELIKDVMDDYSSIRDG